MGLRVFKTTFLVTVDEEEAFASEDDDGPCRSLLLTLDEVKDFLFEALEVDWDVDEYGNPVGLQSMEVLIDELTELPRSEVKKLFPKE